MHCFYCLFFFFQQKTAYELRISDWSSDVVLFRSNGIIGLSPLQYGARTMGIAISAEDRVSTLAANGFKPTGVLMIDKILKPEQRDQIRGQFDDLQVNGREACRERVGQYV